MGKRKLTIKFVTYSAHMGNERMRFILRASKNILWWVKAKKKTSSYILGCTKWI